MDIPHIRRILLEGTKTCMKKVDRNGPAGRDCKRDGIFVFLASGNFV